MLVLDICDPKATRGVIAPNFLRKIALENDFANADSVEILLLNKYDSQL